MTICCCTTHAGTFDTGRCPFCPTHGGAEGLHNLEHDDTIPPPASSWWRDPIYEQENQ